MVKKRNTKRLLAFRLVRSVVAFVVLQRGGDGGGFKKGGENGGVCRLGKIADKEERRRRRGVTRLDVTFQLFLPGFKSSLT